MTEEEKITAEEVGRRITTGMGLVYDLFKEMNSLFRLIAQGLRDSETDIQVIHTKVFFLPRAKKGTTIADLYLRSDMGLLAEIGVTSSSESDDDLDSAEDTEDLDLDTDKTIVSITPDSQYLGIRAVLYDPNLPAEKFTPSLVAAVISSLTKQATGKKAKKAGQTGLQTTFDLKRTLLKRVIKQLQPGAEPNQKIAAKIVGAELAAKVTAADTVPLGEFDSEKRVSEFVEQLTKMVENA